LSDLAHTPPEQVSALVAKRYQGLELLLSLLGKELIGFEASGGHEVFQAHEADVFTLTLKQLPMLNARYLGDNAPFGVILPQLLPS